MCDRGRALTPSRASSSRPVAFPRRPPERSRDPRSAASFPCVRELEFEKDFPMIARPMITRTALLLLGIGAASPALAHTGLDATHGFASAMLHPLLGIDHVLAMGTVGLWAGAVGGRSVFAWPAAFVGVMVVGALIGMSGLALPGIETAIAISVLLLGGAVALRVRASVATGAI